MSSWIKCSDTTPKINESGFISDPVLVVYRSEDGKLNYRVDTYILDRYHKAATFKWNQQKLRKGHAEDYLFWMPIPNFKEVDEI